MGDEERENGESAQPCFVGLEGQGASSLVLVGSLTFVGCWYIGRTVSP